MRIVYEYDSKTKTNTVIISDRDFEQVRREWFRRAWAAKGVTEPERQLKEWRRSGIVVPKWHPFLQGGL